MTLDDLITLLTDMRDMNNLPGDTPAFVDDHHGIDYKVTGVRIRPEGIHITTTLEI